MLSSLLPQKAAYTDGVIAGDKVSQISVHTKSWQKPPVPHIHRGFPLSEGDKTLYYVWLFQTLAQTCSGLCLYHLIFQMNI
jgi:hypothetical protein